MKAHFAIVIDTSRDLVRLTLGGFFAVADVRSLQAERVRRYADLRCAPNQHLTLCDASAMRIQSRDAVAAFSGFVRDPRFLSRKLAIVSNSSLARMQTLRVNPPDRPGLRMFDMLDEAEAWLIGA